MARTPIHPGKILKDELDEIGISAKKLADAIGVPSNRVSEIIRGRRGITAETAVLLGAFFGTSAEFWLNLQMSYELRVARQATGASSVRYPTGRTLPRDHSANDAEHKLALLEPLNPMNVERPRRRARSATDGIVRGNQLQLATRVS